MQLTLTDWLDTDPQVNRDSFDAPWAKSITVKGNQKLPDRPGAGSANINMTGQNAPKGVTLGSFKANAFADGLNMGFAGNVKKIDVKSDVSDLVLEIIGPLDSFTFLGGHEVEVTAEAIGNIKSTGSWLGGRHRRRHLRRRVRQVARED